MRVKAEFFWEEEGCPFDSCFAREESVVEDEREAGWVGGWGRGRGRGTALKRRGGPWLGDVECLAAGWNPALWRKLRNWAGRTDFDAKFTWCREKEPNRKSLSAKSSRHLPITSYQIQ